MRISSIKEREGHEVISWEGQRNSPGHCSFIHQTFLSANCVPCFVVDIGNLEKQILFLGLSFSLPTIPFSHRSHFSQGGLTVRRNNPNTQGLSIIVSHSYNISMWVFSRSLPHSDSGNPGSFHFVALPFSRASESAAGFFASGWQMVEGKESGGFMSLA